MDFVTYLAPSSGNTMVLAVVDRFSKVVHLLPLLKLPSAMETAVIVFDHVLCIHGLPLDMVSDRGPQFTSKFSVLHLRVLSITGGDSEPIIRLPSAD